MTFTLPVHDIHTDHNLVEAIANLWPGKERIEGKNTGEVKEH